MSLTTVTEYSRTNKSGLCVAGYIWNYRMKLYLFSLDVSSCIMIEMIGFFTPKDKFNCFGFLRGLVLHNHTKLWWFSFPSRPKFWIWMYLYLVFMNLYRHKYSLTLLYRHAQYIHIQPCAVAFRSTMDHIYTTLVP